MDKKNEASAKAGPHAGICYRYAGNDLTVCLHCISGILPDLLFHVSGSLISAKKTFVGLDNYKELFGSETFRMVLVNTVVYTVLFVSLTMVLAVIIAVWLNGSKHKKLNNMVEGFIFTPHVISMVSVSIVFLWLMDPDTGF